MFNHCSLREVQGEGEVTDRFPSMDINKAQNECGKPDAFSFRYCPSCKMKVALHCDDCKIQITGCLDTERDRFGDAEFIKRAIDRWGEEEALKKLKSAGFYVPYMGTN